MTTLTDPQGNYSFSGLSTGLYQLEVPDQEVPPGGAGICYLGAFLSHVQVFVGANTPNMDFRLREAGLISGRVLNRQGAPLPGFLLIADAPYVDGGFGRSALTDQNGFYRLKLLPSPGKFYPLRVIGGEHQGKFYAGQWNGEFYRAIVSPGTQVPNMVLDEGGAISGMVTDETLNGLSGVPVSSEHEGLPFQGSHAITGPGGNYTLQGLPVGPNYLQLRMRRFGAELNGIKHSVGDIDLGPINVALGQTTQAGPLVLYRAGAINGVVVDTSGAAVVAAELTLQGVDLGGHDYEKEDVLTDALGQFAMDYVPPGTYSLTVRAEGYPLGLQRDIRIARGQILSLDLLLTVPRDAAAVSGRITNFATVRPKSTDGVPFPFYEDNDYEDYGVSERLIVAVSMDQEFLEEDFLNPTRWLVGRLDDPDIEDGYGDYFEPAPGEVPGAYRAALQAGDVALGLMISNTFHYLARGGSNVFHDWKRFSLTQGDVRSSVDFTAAAGASGTLQGTVLVPAGYPVQSNDWCLVYAYRLDQAQEVETAVPLADAVAFASVTKHYQLQELPAGDYRLRAYAWNLPSVQIPLVTVSPGAATIQDIAFTSGGALEGQVTGPAAVAGATVTIQETGRKAFTDPLGNYRIPGLHTGTYSAAVTARGYAGAAARVNVIAGATAVHNFSLLGNLGSISGKVETSQSDPVNGAKVVAYNETDRSWGTALTVAGAFSALDLTPGQYILAVETADKRIAIHPPDADTGARLTLNPNQDLAGVIIVVETVPAPLFTVSSVFDPNTSILDLEFQSEPSLLAEPLITIAAGQGALGALAANPPLNRFQNEYTAAPQDSVVRIAIEETTPHVPGKPVKKTFTFEVSPTLVATTSTTVPPGNGARAKLMGIQDRTEVYIPPFAIAGTDQKQALTLIIERYGDPGTPVGGQTTASALYDFHFDDPNATVRVNRTFTVTMSFQLPMNMTQQTFADTLEIRYFDVSDQEWRTDGVFNVRINWANFTILFEIAHLSRFAAFISGPSQSDFRRGDSNVDGQLNIGDALQILFLLFGGNQVECRDAADTNDDGHLDISDAILMLQYLYADGPAPHAPFASCGVDPSADNLSCATYFGC